VPKIEYITQLGRVRVSFSRPLAIPDFVTYPEFLEPEMMKPVESRRLQGVTEQQTKDAIDIVNRGLVYVDDKLVPVVELKMKPGTESELQDLDFTWKCVDFKPTYMDISMNYTRYQNVSVHDSKDFLEVKFNGY
jgi:hypothetical protein